MSGAARYVERVASDWFYQGIGELLRDTRTDKGLSQEQLARKAGVSQRAIQNAEIAQSVSIWTLWRIAQALGIEIGELIPVEVKR